jgi:homoserine dehydrogenase
MHLATARAAEEDGAAARGSEAPGPVVVLKFGSSVLAEEKDFHEAAQEIYRHVRGGEKVVALVSALAGETDALLAQAARVGPASAEPHVARLARIGELRSAALLALALARIGLRADTVDPHEIGLVATGPALDGGLERLDVPALRQRLAGSDVVVAPGFIAGHAEHGVATLGRGGSDLSAVFFAARLGARLRLLKDVDGVYDEDPARNPAAKRFGSLPYRQAAGVSRGLIQPKAIEAAAAEGVAIEVAAIAHRDATIIADLPPRLVAPSVPPRLRVALLGCGDVGAGVLACLLERPDLFDLNPVLVRNPTRHAGIAGAAFTASPADALAGPIDLVVELIGGCAPAADIMAAALAEGVHVVTANKAALAAQHERLHDAAAQGGGRLLYSAAVGGGAPVLEAIGRVAAETGVAEVHGVMNGTCNYLLSKLEEGWPLDEALARAQALGFAEADPSLDVDGGDAADKLALIVRAAFGVALAPSAIRRESLRSLTPGAAEAMLAEGRRLKQVGRCRLGAGGRVEARVEVTPLPVDHPLSGARDEENRFLIIDKLGRNHLVFGKGAGRWPTTAAVMADIIDLQRALTEMHDAEAVPGGEPGRAATISLRL